MGNKSDYYDILTSKVLSDNASQDEIKELEEWKLSSEKNLKQFFKSKKVWNTNRNWIPAEAKESDYLKINRKINAEQSRQSINHKFFITLYKAAAILLIPVLIAFGWYYVNSSRFNESIQFTEISAPKGQISKCVLSDGSEVWLNSGTTIKYSNQFNHNFRDVYLDGEAYFKVEKGKSQLFRVITDAVNIQVHGTSFNVAAYKKSNIVETILEEGSIELVLNEKTGQSLFMNPGERATYNIKQQDVVIDKVDTKLLTAWTQGKFLFKDADLRTIFNELERIYDVSIELEHESIGDIRLRGMFEYNHNIVDALYKIGITTNLKYNIQDRIVRISY